MSDWWLYKQSDGSWRIGNAAAEKDCTAFRQCEIINSHELNIPLESGDRIINFQPNIWAWSCAKARE